MKNLGVEKSIFPLLKEKIFLKIEKKQIKRAKKAFKHTNNLLNKGYLNKIILTHARFSESHGANKRFLGFGILYYSFVYMLKAKVAVCLGSGGGFVPRIMRQAQIDLGIENKSTTILIDANIPEAGWENPDYLYKQSFLKNFFPDIVIIVKTTKDASKIFKSQNIKMDYLHIDADHSHKGSLFDYETYRPFMSNNFIITMHDTHAHKGVAETINQIREKNDVEIINFDNLWDGLAIIKPKNAPHISNPSNIPVLEPFVKSPNKKNNIIILILYHKLRNYYYNHKTFGDSLLFIMNFLLDLTRINKILRLI